MSRLHERTETWNALPGRRGESGWSPQSVLWLALAPYRATAIDLGFSFVLREVSPSLRGRTDLFVHPCGTWLDLSGSLDRALHFRNAVAEFRTWAEVDGALAEMATRTATPTVRPPLRRLIGRLLTDRRDEQVLGSPADLRLAFAQHESRLRAIDAVPLLPHKDALEHRRGCEAAVCRGTLLVAPP